MGSISFYIYELMMSVIMETKEKSSKMKRTVYLLAQDCTHRSFRSNKSYHDHCSYQYDK